MPDTTGLPNLDGLVDKLVEDAFAPLKMTRVQNAMRNAQAEGQTIAAGAVHAATKKLVADEVTFKRELEELGGWVSAWFLSAIVENTFDVDIDNQAFAHLGATAGRKAVAKRVTDKMVEGLTGGNTSIEASQQPAANYLSVVFGQVFEAWALGEIVEIVSAVFPGIEKVEHIADLGDKLVAAMGITDTSSRVLRPYIDTLVVEPLRRHIATTYRPGLMSESLAVRQFLRGRITREQLDDELALQGWSADRIEAHINANSKGLSLGDSLQLVRHGRLGRDAALQVLRDSGYDEATAELALVAEESRRFDSYNDNPLAAITRAYVDRELSDSEFRSFLPAIIVDEIDRTAYASGAAIQRGLNVKHLTHGEVIDCVRKKILTRIDYRHWLAREGYPPEDSAALELRLVKDMDVDADIEEERARIAAARAAEKLARDQAAAQRRADVEAERALHRRGPLSDLERAAIRGLIPLSRVEEVLAQQYDADTVQILLELVEADRVAYVDAQQRAADAKQRAGRRNVDVGDLEQAVLNNVLTLGEYTRRLQSMGFDADDAAILSSTLEARKADLDDARAKRAAAEKVAKTRSIDLGRFERLVRRGVRTMADYDGLLKTLDFDDGSRAAMIDLLRLDIADDEEARRLREAPKPPPAPKTLSLEQARRAVLLGLSSEDFFQTYLVQAGYTPDAQRLLLAELERDVADADEARRRREAAEAASGVVALPLSRVAGAARLGLISPATYQARLKRDGYTPDDIAIEMELLLVEIADTQAARARREALEAAAALPQRASVQQLERAVRAGTASLDEYRFALAQVYGPDDVELLANTLEAELAALDEARARRVTIGGELAARTLSIGDLEAGVAAGALTFEQYRDQLLHWGYGLDDAELLTALLAEKLAPAPAEGDGG